MKFSVKTLKILTKIISVLLLTVLISCADTYPTLNNAALLSLLGESTESSDPAAQSGSLYVYSPNLLATTEDGGTAEAQIYLKQAPASDVTISFVSSNTAEGTVITQTLTFTSQNYSTPQTLQIQGVDDALSDGSVFYTIDASVSTADPDYSAEASFSIDAVNYDNETSTPGILVTPTSGIYTTEGGGSGVFSVVLLTAPSADVTLTLSSSDSNEAAVSTGSLTFTSANWSTPQNVNVTGVNDFFADGNKNFTVSFDPAVSADTSYSGITASSVTGTNYDNDTAGIILNGPVSTTVSETGTTSTFTIRLTSAPQGSATVSIPLTSTDSSQVLVSPASLTFTDADWSTPQTVTVSAVDDTLTDGTATVTVTIGSSTSTDTDYNGLAPSPSSYSYTVLDNEAGLTTPGILVSPVSGLITTEAGGTAVFSVVLKTKPTASVSIPVASSNTAEGSLSAGTLVFTTTDWDQPQNVTVTGVNDTAADGNKTYTVNLGPAVSTDSNYNAVTAASVGLTNYDDETPGIIVSSPSQTFVTEGGGTATFTVRLQSQPAADVTIALISDDTSEGTVNPASLTFTSTDWMTAQTVTVTGADDLISDGHITFTLTIDPAVSADSDYNGLNPADFTFITIDNDLTKSVVAVNASSLVTSEAGGSASFQLVLNTAPSATVTVGPVQSNDTTEGIAAGEPLYLTFTTANWSIPQTVFVTGQYDSDTSDTSYSVGLGTASSTDPEWNGVVSPDVNLTNQDVLLEITKTIGSAYLDENGSCAWVSFVLTVPPTADVVLGPMESLDTTEASIGGQPLYLTFTSFNWSWPQFVYICGVADSDTADQLFTTDFGTSSSADTNYDAISLGTTDLTNINTWPPAPADLIGTLTVDGGYSGFSVASTKYVTFDVNAGTVYRVNWDDAGQGSGSYTANILGKLYYSDRSVIMNYTDHGYLSGYIFTATQTGTVYLELYPAYATGTVGASVSTVTPPSSLLGNFEGVWDSFTYSGLWHISSVRSTTGTYSARFANDGTGSDPLATFSTGATVTGDLISPSFTAGTLISFDYYLDGECSAGLVCFYDKLTIHISNDGGVSWIQIADLTDTEGLGMRERILDISGYTGQSVKLRFYFNSVDSAANFYEGAYIDNIRY